MNAEQFQKQTGVSRETLQMYGLWYNLLSHWNKKINLVARSTIHDFWLRHALDSWQVVDLMPKDTKTILDMGAGAGFPGLAMAIELKNTPEVQITLVEANGKKCNFLRTVIRECSLPAKAEQTRIENFRPQAFDVITARAFTSLVNLLEYSAPFWADNTLALFPKGENWQKEVNLARESYSFDLSTTGSKTGEGAKVLAITNLQTSVENNKEFL